MCARFVRREDGDSSRRTRLGLYRFVDVVTDAPSSSYHYHRFHRGYRSAVSLAMILALVLSFPAALVVMRPLVTVMALHIDPEIHEALMLGYTVDAYVVAEPDTAIPLKPMKTWRFGDSIVVYKVRITDFNELNLLVNTDGVISVYGDKVYRHAPLYWLDVSQYPIAKYDADNRLHRADGDWIGRGVTVAVIDTGIDYTHPDFFDEQNQTIIKVLVSTLYVTNTQPFIYWEPGVNGTIDDLLSYDLDLWQRYGEPAFLDINGHGTHVAGIIAGQGHASNGKYLGIAPGARLVVIKAFNRDGATSTEIVLNALQWVYDNVEKYGIDVLSLSWGAAYASDGTDPISMACNAIASKGVLIFAAAGNEGNLPTTIVVPAVAEKVFAVGAWDPYYDRVAPFSSMGPTIDMRMKPDFMGAGVMVVAPRSRYVQFPRDYLVGDYYVALSGTSMATPAVAGVAACFIEYYRYWYGRDPSMQDFVQWVLHNGRRINWLAKDFITGWGIPHAP